MTEGMNRREVLTAAMVAAAAICTLDTCEKAAAQNAPPQQPPTSLPVIVDVGAKSQFDKDAIFDKWSHSNRIMIVRGDHKIYAISATCTHRGCIVKPVDDSGFACPCHHAAYDLTGVVTHRPARFPLQHYGISVNDQGNVIVDRSKTFDPAEMDAAGSFIPV